MKPMRIYLSCVCAALHFFTVPAMAGESIQVITFGDTAAAEKDTDKTIVKPAQASPVLADAQVVMEGEGGAGLGSGVPVQELTQPNCWAAAGTKYRIDPWLLYSIAQHESSLRPRVVSKPNRDGTYDIGIMQVNSWWLGQLAKYGIKERDLFDACTNIHVGAWILAQAMSAMGPNWDAVGAYNAGVKRTEKRSKLRAGYAALIYRRYRDNLRVFQ